MSRARRRRNIGLTLGALVVGATLSGCCCDLFLFIPIDEVDNPSAARQAAMLRPNLDNDGRSRIVRAARANVSRPTTER